MNACMGSELTNSLFSDKKLKAGVKISLPQQMQFCG
jgi:hypothetical protein